MTSGLFYFFVPARQRLFIHPTYWTDLQQHVLLAAMMASYLAVTRQVVWRLDSNVYTWNERTDLFNMLPSLEVFIWSPCSHCSKHPWLKWWSGGNFGQLFCRQEELINCGGDGSKCCSVGVFFLIRGGELFFSLKWFGGLFVCFFTPNHFGKIHLNIVAHDLCISELCPVPNQILDLVSKTLTWDS